MNNPENKKRRAAYTRRLMELIGGGKTVVYIDETNCNLFLRRKEGAGMAEWSGELVSLPAICRLRVQFPSPPGHADLPTTGASVNVV